MTSRSSVKEGTPLEHQYRLKVLRAQNVIWKPGRSRSSIPSLCLQLTVGGKSYARTKAIETLEPTWDESMPLLTAGPGSIVEVTLKHHSKTNLKWRDVILGSARVSIAELVALGSSGEVSVTMCTSGNATSAVVFLEITQVNTSSALVELTSKALVDANAIQHSFPIVESLGLSETIGKLVYNLDCVKNVIDEFAQLHPFVNVAWTIASALYEIVKTQIEADRAILRLAEKLSKCLDFAVDADTLRHKLYGTEKSFVRLFNQITECCLFIREYVGKGFIRRALRQGTQDKINDFIKSLDESTTAMDQGINLNAAIVTVRVATKVNQLYLRERLRPDEMDVYGRPACLPGTRVSILEDITTWLLTDSSQNILWLHGAAGSGKSTIARSIQDRMIPLARLGAYLCFERGKSLPNGVIRTLAYQLASYDSRIAEKVTAVLGNSDVAVTPLRNQFDTLLARPLSDSVNTTQAAGPVVIIIDALDECGDSVSRKELLRVFEGLAELPPNYRFLFTGRPETDLHQAFLNPAWSDHVRPFYVDCGSEEARDNVLAYLRKELRKVVPPSNENGQENIRKLAQVASGLFISASTAVKMIIADDFPLRKLGDLASGDVRLDNLDQLYTTVLRNSGIQWDNADSTSLFKNIISFMILRKAALSDDIIDGMFDRLPQDSSGYLLEKLRPLIDYQPGQPLYFRHVTIPDYFLASSKGGLPWSIDINSQRYSLAARCFIFMGKHLRFNIAGLRSSYIANDQVDGLAEKIPSILSPPLRYVSLHWAKHLSDCDSTRGASQFRLLDLLDDFLKKQLLYWLEVLSLLKITNPDMVLGDAGRWLNSSSESGSHTASFLKDARKLLNTCHELIGLSIPHIYLSMLPLMHPTSTTAAHYFHRLFNTGLTVTHCGARKTSRWLKTLRVDDITFVTCIAFSPVDATRLVSGSFDGKIRVWDIESGEVIYSPTDAHDGIVRCLLFTSNGKRVISVGKDSAVKLWDLDDHSSETVGRHNEAALLAISRDDAVLATSDDQGAVKVWHLNQARREGRTINLENTGIVSLAFRPTHERWLALASRTRGAPIRLWNTNNNDMKNFPLTATERAVRRVLFTSDGNSLISASLDGEIRIRDVNDGTVLSILTGHTDTICSLHLSSATGYLFTQSSDRTLRVWDVVAGAAVGKPIIADFDFDSISWSCNEQQIATLSLDGAVLGFSIYDAALTSREPSNDPGHSIDSNSVTQVIDCGVVLTAAVIASDGSWIAAGRADGVLGIWRKHSCGAWARTPELRKQHVGAIVSIARSSDDAWLATRSEGENLCVWSIDFNSLAAESLQVVTSIDIGEDLRLDRYTQCITFSPVAGSCDLASANYDRGIGIWNCKTGKLTRSFEAAQSNWISVAYSPDGAAIAAGSETGFVGVWNADTCQCRIIQCFDSHTSPQVFSLSFSSDGHLIAMSAENGAVQVWDIASEKRLFDFSGIHASKVTSVSFSPDDKYLASGSWDSTIKLLDTGTGECRQMSERSHRDWINSLVFSSDGASIISSSDDGTIRVWDPAKFSLPAPVLQKDGWLVDEDKNLLLWIPPDLRASLLWEPAQLDVLGHPFSTRVEFSKEFSEGSWLNWTQ